MPPLSLCLLYDVFFAGTRNRPFTLAALKSAIFLCYKKDGTFDL